MDNTFWAFVALVISLALFWYAKAPGKIGKTLDDHAGRVRRELEEARALKEEARQQLAEYQRRRQEAEADAREIVAAASREAEMLLEDARRRNEDYVARRTQMAETKIAQAEADAIAEVRNAAIDIAVAAAGRIIADRGASGDGSRFIDQSLGEVQRRLN